MKTVIVTFMFSLLVIVNSQVTLNLFITTCRGTDRKVMFSQVSVCPHVFSMEMGISGTRSLQGGYFQGISMYGGGYVQGSGYPFPLRHATLDTMVYGWQVGNTHPTGMLSFY